MNGASQGPLLHPCRDEHGQPTLIARPSLPSPLAAWLDPDAIATVVPGGAMPPQLNGVALAPWTKPPAHTGEWRAYAADTAVAEPAYAKPDGMRAAAGVVIVEDDGRVWLVSPTNGFGGYQATFPKGRLDAGATLQCTAIREAFEESGLQVRLLAHLLDCARTQTYTRYYVARRVGGSPAAMGWESQAAHLVPAGRLASVATHPNDRQVIAAIQDWLACV